MAWHPPGDRVDRVLDLDPPLLQRVGELLDHVLRLGHGEAVAGHHHHPAGVGQHRPDVLGAPRPDAAIAARAQPLCGDLDLAEGPEQDVRDRAAHGVAHELGQERTGGSNQGAGHDQREVVQDEPAGRHRQAGAGVEQRDHDGHVRAADREDERDAEHEREGEHRHDDHRLPRDRQQDDRERDDGGGQHAVDDLLAGVGDRRAGHQLLELGEGDRRAGEGDAADDDREDAREPGLKLGAGPGGREQLGHRHQGGRPAADPVEEGDHLGHRSHLHPPRPDRPGDRADRDSHDADQDPRAGEAAPKGDERPDHRDGHADRGHRVAAPGAPRRAQELQPHDEQDRRQEVDERGGDDHLAYAGRRPLALAAVFCAWVLPRNISSIRSVTTKPPTTLVVARTTARKPRTICSGV